MTDELALCRQRRDELKRELAQARLDHNQRAVERIADELGALDEREWAAREKVCRRCRKRLPFSEFYNRKDRKDGLHDWCKACCNSNRQARISRSETSTERRIGSMLGF